MNKNLKLFLIALLIFIALVFGKKIFKSDSSKDTNKNKNIDTVQISKLLVQKVRPTKMSANIEISGYIDAKNTITIVSQTDGVVKEILLSQGQKVNEGDIILLIDEKDKVAALKKTDQLVEQKKKELNISNSLLRTGDTPLTLNNQAKTAYEDAITQLERAKNQLDFTKVRATISGYLDRIEIKKGDHINERTIITKIFDNKNFIAVASIPQSKIQTIDVGQKATIFINNMEFTGTLNFLSNIADQKTKNYYGEIQLNLNEKDKNLIIKMINTPVRIKISYDELLAVKLSDSVTYLNDEGYITLKTLNKENIVTSIPVELLSSDKTGMSWFYNEEFINNEEIDVIVRGGGFVNDGDKVDSLEYVEK